VEYLHNSDLTVAIVDNSGRTVATLTGTYGSYIIWNVLYLHNSERTVATQFETYVGLQYEFALVFTKLINYLGQMTVIRYPAGARTDI